MNKDIAECHRAAVLGLTTETATPKANMPRTHSPLVQAITESTLLDMTTWVLDSTMLKVSMMVSISPGHHREHRTDRLTVAILSCAVVKLGVECSPSLTAWGLAPLVCMN